MWGTSLLPENIRHSFLPYALSYELVGTNRPPIFVCSQKFNKLMDKVFSYLRLNLTA